MVQTIGNPDGAFAGALVIIAGLGVSPTDGHPERASYSQRELEREPVSQCARESQMELD